MEFEMFEAITEYLERENAELERELSERILLPGECEFRTLAENSPDHIIRYDRECRGLYVNHMVEDTTGVSGTFLLGKTPLECYPDGMYEGGYPEMVNYQATLQLVMATGRVEDVDLHIPDPGGGLRIHNIRMAPEMDAAGSIVGALAFGRDITESKLVEEAQEKLQAELLQARKMESVGRLAGGVAHDFNNMLGVIIGYTEMALTHVDPASPLYDELRQIQYAAERSAELTQKLLTFARKQMIAQKVLDLNETVAGMLRMLRRLIGENIEITWLPGAALWPIEMDLSQIDQILVNLCVNARDAITGCGAITIKTATATIVETCCAGPQECTPGDYVLLSVSDDGCGMNTDTIHSLFEPFFTTKELGKGTGLGLATVYGTVQQNNGFINVTSEPGHGTTFNIYLPRYAAETGQTAEESRVVPVVPGNETILLAEDEPSLLKMTSLMLASFGYLVLSASTPDEAIRLADEHAEHIHLLVTDVLMPGMNGRALADELSSRHPGIKVLFMSGYTGDVIAQHDVLYDGINFIQKPFSGQAMATKVREALDGYRLLG